MTLKLVPGRIAGLVPIFQQGFLVEVPRGSTLKNVLDAAGLPREYLERRVQTIFVDGSVIDDIDSGVNDGSIVALSAAMPGLAGAIFRKGSPLSGLRSRTDGEKDDGCRPGGAKLVLIKLFNIVAEEMGPELLRKGVVLNRTELESFFHNRRELIEKTIIDAELDGEKLCCTGLFDKCLPCSEHVFLSVA